MIRVFFLIWFSFLTTSPLAGESRDVTWSDLVPQKAEDWDDPFEELSEGQLIDLGMIARIRYLLESEKTPAGGADAKEEKRLVEKLTKAGIEVDWILSQRERVAQMRQAQAEKVDEGIADQEIRIPGYVLALSREEGLVREFLLVPWVGACIHTPPPPPNQMIHVSIAEGIKDPGRFAAVWIEGKVELKPASYDLFLVDGKRSVKVSYRMEIDSVELYSSKDSDVLAQVEIPEFGEGHSWWWKMQAKVSLLFTKTMTDIRDRQSSGPLLMGLLVAFLYGLVHTLGPGHGKAVVISYFAGEGGGLMRGVGMGVKIAIFHVLSAVIVVWVMDFAVRQATGAAPSDYRTVKLISYASIIVIGGWMLRRALKSGAHEHHHDHDHDDHHSGCEACAVAAGKKGMAGWLALAVGSVPCTGALLVLLFGMANDLLGPAIMLVVAISVGMAVAMSGIGVLALLGRRVVDRKFTDQGKQDRFARVAQILGAAAVLLIGCALFSLTWFVAY